MENNNGESKLVGRRRTLQLLGVGLGAGGLLALSGCPKSSSSGGGGGGKTSTSDQDCDSTIDETSRNLRKVLQYNDKAVDPAKHCEICAQFEAGKYGDCGACKLFTGPVNPKGGCLSFAPKGAEAGAAVKPT